MNRYYDENDALESYKHTWKMTIDGYGYICLSESTIKPDSLAVGLN